MTKILIIEDEIKLLETLSELLSLGNYDVVEAKNGLEGFEKVTQTNPDLIICDIMMPVLDGYGFIKRLKQSDHHNIPVLFLTAKTELTDQQRGIDLGAKAYILKPFSFQELNLVIEKHLLDK